MCYLISLRHVLKYFKNTLPSKVILQNFEGEVKSLTTFFFNFLFIYDSHAEREREAETQAEGEAGSMHWEPDVGFDPGSPGSRPGPKAGAKPLRHPGIPKYFLKKILFIYS